jgi:hypothetical protein
MIGWALCVCGHGAVHHEAVVLTPICVELSGRVLFEGILGGCRFCECGAHKLEKVDYA